MRVFIADHYASIRFASKVKCCSIVLQTACQVSGFCISYPESGVINVKA
ncbi:hypothetical protein C3B55_00394 [Candidatus Pseudomonas adelgestsugas]|uniref:Uncharacterized protein n=1 Tax=Candidatus Pseudomonas adelgestsugas TaxID=1302376 RepID=A0ABX5R8I5_9PSED|nr:hypothetical protein C3B55_00394 [Candidatus Pseudomonas adelgestsugas]